MRQVWQYATHLVKVGLGGGQLRLELVLDGREVVVDRDEVDDAAVRLLEVYLRREERR